MNQNSRNQISKKIMRKQIYEIMILFGLIATCSSVGASGSTAHGPVSFAIQRTGGACPARPWPLATHAADVRFSAMGAFARIQPGIPDAVGADLAVGRPDPRRLPAPAAPLYRGHRRRQILSVHRVSRIGRR